MRDDTGCCQKFSYTLRDELQRERFSLEHFEPQDFCRSQWQRGRRSIIWVIYRWLLAIFFSAGVIASFIQQWMGGRWFIYLTDWGFLLVMYTCVFGAVIATMHYINPDRFTFDCYTMQIYWLSYWSTVVLALLITFVFWIFLFPLIEMNGLDLYNIWAHAFNSLFMLIDFMLVAFPVRLMHFIFPFLIGITYGIFSLIYYFAGGVDFEGHRYIYPILDWSKPGLSIGTIFGCMILLAIFCFLLFGLYKLRVWLHKKCCLKTVIMNEA